MDFLVKLLVEGISLVGGGQGQEGEAEAEREVSAVHDLS